GFRGLNALTGWWNEFAANAPWEKPCRPVRHFLPAPEYPWLSGISHEVAGRLVGAALQPLLGSVAQKSSGFAKLRNAQIKGADSCMPFPMPIAVPLVGSFCVAFITFGTNLGCNLRLHQRMNKNIQS